MYETNLLVEMLAYHWLDLNDDVAEYRLKKYQSPVAATVDAVFRVLRDKKQFQAKVVLKCSWDYSSFSMSYADRFALISRDKDGTYLRMEDPDDVYAEVSSYLGSDTCHNVLMKAFDFVYWNDHGESVKIGKDAEEAHKKLMQMKRTTLVGARLDITLRYGTEGIIATVKSESEDFCLWSEHSNGVYLCADDADFSDEARVLPGDFELELTKCLLMSLNNQSVLKFEDTFLNRNEWHVCELSPMCPNATMKLQFSMDHKLIFRGLRGHGESMHLVLCKFGEDTVLQYDVLTDSATKHDFSCNELPIDVNAESKLLFFTIRRLIDLCITGMDYSTPVDYTERSQELITELRQDFGSSKLAGMSLF